MSKENNSEIVTKLKEIARIIDECIPLLSSDQAQVKTETQKKSPKSHSSVDFSIPIRPFVKKYSTGMSGPKKFTLLVAYLTNADPKKTVPLEEVKNQWNKMSSKGLLGMKFNLFYSSSSRENDWVHTPSTATYSVRPSWKDILL